jgi:hypothetical protein
MVGMADERKAWRGRADAKGSPKPSRGGASLIALVLCFDSLVDGVYRVGALGVDWVAIEAGPSCFGARTMALGAGRRDGAKAARVLSGLCGFAPLSTAAARNRDWGVHIM